MFYQIFFLLHRIAQRKVEKFHKHFAEKSLADAEQKLKECKILIRVIMDVIKSLNSTT